jgi:hypothetical protein
MREKRRTQIEEEGREVYYLIYIQLVMAIINEELHVDDSIATKKDMLLSFFYFLSMLMMQCRTTSKKVDDSRYK